MRVLVLFSFLSIIRLCHGQGDPSLGLPGYNDLKDYGYHGKVKSVSIAMFKNPVNYSGKWRVTDSASSRGFDISYEFDEKGNLVIRKVKFTGNDHRIIYEYKNGVKTGWKKINEEGDTISYAVIKPFSDSGFVETEYGLKKKDLLMTKYYLGPDLRTTRMRDEWKNEEGKTVSLSLTDYKNGPEGYIGSFTVKDLLNNVTDSWEWVILQKDKMGNPLEILVKKNGKPMELRYLAFDYYP